MRITSVDIRAVVVPTIPGRGADEEIELLSEMLMNEISRAIRPGSAMVCFSSARRSSAVRRMPASFDQKPSGPASMDP